MAQYYMPFDGYSNGTNLYNQDWNVPTGNQIDTFEADTRNGEEVLKTKNANDTMQSGVRNDFDGSYTDVEFYYSVQPDDTAGTGWKSSSVRPFVLARESGGDFYGAGVRGVSDSGNVALACYGYINNSIDSAKSFKRKAIISSEYDAVSCRVQFSGNNIKVKAWLKSNSEPSSWDLSFSDSEFSSAGQIGYLIPRDYSYSYYLFEFGVGTGGDSAPTGPLFTELSAGGNIATSGSAGIEISRPFSATGNITSSGSGTLNRLSSISATGSVGVSGSGSIDVNRYIYGFGDVALSALVDKSTTVDRETITKNFVGEKPSVYELNPTLEAGTYTVIHNEEIHPYNHSLDEQVDAVQSMASRHATEFPFGLSGDRGHIMVDSVSSSIGTSKQFRESSLDIRFFDDDTYRPAFVLSSSPLNDNFSISNPSSTIGLPSIVEDVEDSDGNSLNPLYNIVTTGGEFEIYEYDSSRNIIEFDRWNVNYTADERRNPVRLYDQDNNRVYSQQVSFEDGSELGNGKIKILYGDPDSQIQYFDGSWYDLGTLGFGSNYGYPVENENYEVVVDFLGSFTTRMNRAFPAIECTITNSSDFSLNCSEDITDTDVESTDWYRVVEDSRSREIILIRTNRDGSFNATIDYVSVEGIDDAQEYTFFVGVIPDGISISEFAKHVYCQGRQKRTFVQR